MFVLATKGGLATISTDGELLSMSREGDAVKAVVPLEGELAIAVEGRGVLIGSGEDWRQVGLEDQIIWTLGAQDGSLYAGLEPAAIMRLEHSGDWTELSGLTRVDGYSGWHSPWGPADLCSIVAEPDRLIVGIEIGGVAISMDGGLSWMAANSGLFEDVHAVVAVGDCLVATTGGGLHCSRNGGENWTWESEGMDRGYTQGLAIAGDNVLVSAASGPPPMWESNGPEAAIFRARLTAEPLEFVMTTDKFVGNVGRLGMASSGDAVVAGTSAGELLVSHDAGATFEILIRDLPEINDVTIVG